MLKFLGNVVKVVTLVGSLLVAIEEIRSMFRRKRGQEQG